MQQNLDYQQPKQTAFISNQSVNSKIDLNKKILLTESKSYYQHQDYSDQMVQLISRNDSQSIKIIIQTHEKLKLKQTYCQNILKIVQIDLSNPTDILIISDKCDCTLKQLFKQRENYWFSNEEICNIIGQIINGYCYLKENGIIYKNLHPDSIFIKCLPQNQYQVILSDYSNCIFESEQISNQTKLPPFNYLLLIIAPEYIQQNNQEYTFLSDIFSLGIILYQLCYQKQISQTEQEHIQILKSIQTQQQLQLPQNINVSRQLIELLQRMLQFNPQNRINWEQLQQQQLLKLQFNIIQGYLIQFNKKKIGSGNQASVYQAINLTSQEFYSAKLVYNNQTEGQREIEIYSKLKSKNTLNVVRVFDILNDNNKTYFILEKCDENLETYYLNNKPLDKDQILNILKQVVDGYCHLKQLQILHRNLKAQNILVKYMNNKPYFKIINFGVGTILDKRGLTYTMADFYATAPEVLESKDYNYQCDIYSFGVLLFEITYSRQYIEANTLNEHIQKLQKLERQPFRCPQPLQGNSLSECQKYFTPLIENLVQYNPEKRLKWEVLQELIAQNISNQSDQFLIPQQYQYSQHQQLLNNNNWQQANQQQINQNNYPIRIINQYQQQNQQIQQAQIQIPQIQPVSLLGGFLTHNSTTTDNIICYLTCLYVLSTKTKELIIPFINKNDSELNGLLYFMKNFSLLCLGDILCLFEQGSILLQGQFIELTNDFDKQNLNIIQLKQQYNLLQQQQFEEFQTQLKDNNNQHFKLLFSLKILNEAEGKQTSFDGSMLLNQYFKSQYVQQAIQKLELQPKYYSHLLKNVYYDFPILNYKQYQISDITQTIYVQQKAQDYLKSKKIL